MFSRKLVHHNNKHSRRYTSAKALYFYCNWC